VDYGITHNNNLDNYIISPIVNKNYNFTPRIRLAILASGEGTNFEAILKEIKSNTLQAEIRILIVNNDNCGVIKRAKKYGIAYKIIDHKIYKNRLDFDQKIIDELEEYNIECIVMAGWMRIVTPILINRYNKRIINIHPSLLPSFKGLKAIKQAFDYEVAIIGCTAHIVEENVDCGKILAQAAMVLNNSEEISLIESKIHRLEHKILPMAINIAIEKCREIF
tara:strand:+ start:446 stop:1111 length:666 start_codon:yes stop_codon:yes gene_type:complete